MKTQYFDLWRIKHVAHHRRVAVLGSPVAIVGGWFIQAPAHPRHQGELK